MNAAHAALGFLIASLLTAGGMLGAAWILRVRARRFSPLKARPYECGEEASGPAWLQFHARYYLVALVFVLFDVEAVFLFPWALAYRQLDFFAFGAGLLFIFLLTDALFYAWGKNALEWS